MVQIVKRNSRFLLGLFSFALLMYFEKIMISHAFLGLSLAVPGLGSGLGGALFGAVGIFWGTVAGVASMGAGIVVSL